MHYPADARQALAVFAGGSGHARHASIVFGMDEGAADIGQVLYDRLWMHGFSSADKKDMREGFESRP